MVELLLRIGCSLLVVLGLMWLLAKAARRPLSRRGAAGGLRVLSRAQLTRGAGVAVVQVDGRALILGVTESQVSLLGEADLAEARRHLDEPATAGRAPAAATPAAPRGVLHGSLLSPRTWVQTVEALRERTLRR